MRYMCPLSDICSVNKKHCKHSEPHCHYPSCNMVNCSFTNRESNIKVGLGLESKCIPCIPIPEGDFIAKDEFEI